MLLEMYKEQEYTKQVFDKELRIHEKQNKDSIIQNIVDNFNITEITEIE